MEDDALIDVVLIEDHADTAELIRALLARSRGVRFSVRCATCLQDGLRERVPEESGVVLLDLTLPDSGGFDTFTAARQRWANAPIVVLSAVDDESLALRAVREGAQDYLVKGAFGLDLLVRAIRYAIERKHAELALAHERNLLRSLIDGLPDHVYVKDLDGRFIIVNRATRLFFGAASDADLLGKTDADLFPAETAAAFRAEEQDLAGAGLPSVSREAMVTHHGSPPIWVHTQKVPMRDAGGRVVGVVGVNRDVTERRRARDQLESANVVLADRQRELLGALADLQQSHEALRSAQLQLVQSEKMESIGRLAAGVAHEVKNPLAVIMLGVEFLSRRAEAGADGGVCPAPVLNTMADAVRRADLVVRGLLDFAAPGTLTLTSTPLATIVRRALLLVKHELMRARATVRDELPADLPRVAVDVAKVEQVLVNLLINAAHAVSAGGVVTLRGRAGRCGDVSPDRCGDPAERPPCGSAVPPAADQPVVVIDVDDTGCGIPPDHMHKLFEPFFTTKPVGKGNGLGLSVSRTIMELHGGSIHVRNRPEGGARATLVFIPERT